MTAAGIVACEQNCGAWTAPCPATAILTIESSYQANAAPSTKQSTRLYYLIFHSIILPRSAAYKAVHLAKVVSGSQHLGKGTVTGKSFRRRTHLCYLACYILTIRAAL